MLINKFALENVRSFLDRREISFDGGISILIGPNGGGKTNLLDALTIMLRGFVMAAPYFREAPTPENPDLLQETPNDYLNNMLLEKHSIGSALPQVVSIVLEVTKDDVENMKAIKAGGDAIKRKIRQRFTNDPS